MTSTLTQRLQRAVALRDATTPGEWRRDAMGGSSTVLTQAKPSRNDTRIPTYGYRDGGEHCIGYPFIEDDGRIRRDFICLSHEDAAFIAAAPSIVQLAVELGAEVERMRKALSEQARLALSIRGACIRSQQAPNVFEAIGDWSREIIKAAEDAINPPATDCGDAQ